MFEQCADYILNYAMSMDSIKTTADINKVSQEADRITKVLLDVGLMEKEVAHELKRYARHVAIARFEEETEDEE